MLGLSLPVEVGVEHADRPEGIPLMMMMVMFT
jgi:hypothetical protein